MLNIELVRFEAQDIITTSGTSVPMTPLTPATPIQPAECAHPNKETLNSNPFGNGLDRVYCDDCDKTWWE